MLTDEQIAGYERQASSGDFNSMHEANMTLACEVRRLKRPCEHCGGTPGVERPLPTEDRWRAWMEKHQEEVAKYSGMDIAVHPTLGIVASASSLRDLWVAVNALDSSIYNEILLAVAPVVR